MLVGLPLVFASCPRDTDRDSDVCDHANCQPVLCGAQLWKRRLFHPRCHGMSLLMLSSAECADTQTDSDGLLRDSALHPPRTRHRLPHVHFDTGSDGWLHEGKTRRPWWSRPLWSDCRDRPPSPSKCYTTSTFSASRRPSSSPISDLVSPQLS